MKIEKIKIEEIIPYANNAKLHPRKQIDQIKQSIQEFGFNDPLAIDEDNVVIEGNGRLLALKELGYTEVECIRLTGLSEEQKKAYILIHNKLTMNTGFDLEILKNELSEIEYINMEDFDFDIDFSIEEDEFEDIDDEDKGNTMSFEHKLKVDKIEIVLTDDEYYEFEKRFNNYVDINGVSFGFMKELLGL